MNELLAYALEHPVTQENTDPAPYRQVFRMHEHIISAIVTAHPAIEEKEEGGYWHVSIGLLSEQTDIGFVPILTKEWSESQKKLVVRLLASLLDGTGDGIKAEWETGEKAIHCTLPMTTAETTLLGTNPAP